MDQHLISLLYFIMFGPKLFWFSYNARIPEKDKKGKTTQDVTHAADAGGQCSRGIQASICPRHQKCGNLARRMLLSLGYHRLYSVGISVGCSEQLE